MYYVLRCLVSRILSSSQSDRNAGLLKWCRNNVSAVKKVLGLGIKDFTDYQGTRSQVKTTETLLKCIKEFLNKQTVLRQLVKRA